jgi:hypothetical protein
MSVELEVAGSWRDGFVVVFEHGDERVIESRAYVKGSWGSGPCGGGL